MHRLRQQPQTNAGRDQGPSTAAEVTRNSEAGLHITPATNPAPASNSNCCLLISKSARRRIRIRQAGVHFWGQESSLHQQYHEECKCWLCNERRPSEGHSGQSPGHRSKGDANSHVGGGGVL